MFRDTFAVEMLLAGLPLEQVSILLGHKSVKITEKHFAPWVKARQELLAANVRKAWQSLNQWQEVAPEAIATREDGLRRPSYVFQLARCSFRCTRSKTVSGTRKVR